MKFDTIFKGFKENPTATFLSLLVLAVVALFGIIVSNYSSAIKDSKKATTECLTEKYIVQTQMERLNEKYIETFGLLREVQSEIKILKKVAKLDP